MPDAYRLPCPACGAEQALVPQQAGQSVACTSCAKAFFAPSLRDLKRLPRVGDAGDGSASGRTPQVRAIERARSRRMLGVVALSGGLLLTTVALAAVGMAAWLRSGLDLTPPPLDLGVEQVDALRSMSARETWHAFHQMQQVDISGRQDPKYLADRAQHEVLGWVMVVGAALAGVGAVGLVLGFVLAGGQSSLRPKA